MSRNRKPTNAEASVAESEAALDAAISAAASTTPIARLLIEQGRSAVYIENGAMVYVPATGAALPKRPQGS